MLLELHNAAVTTHEHQLSLVQKVVAVAVYGLTVRHEQKHPANCAVQHRETAKSSTCLPAQATLEPSPTSCWWCWWCCSSAAETVKARIWLQRLSAHQPQGKTLLLVLLLLLLGEGLQAAVTGYRRQVKRYY
jgi:hypothetical protein